LTIATAKAVPPRQKPQKKRIDVLLVERGLAETRQRAQALILAGQVQVNRQQAQKAGALVAADASIEVAGETLRYASRGGLKLEGALLDFGIDPDGRVCLDVGSSTGGFTDCLLQQGARRVYAVDVNVDQLAWKLQKDPRVVKVKRNARYLNFDDIGAWVDLATIDLSFISVAKVLSAVRALVKPGGDLLVLVKPQFELDRKDVGKGGIVRDPALHEHAIARVRAAAESLGLRILGVQPSRLPGAGGNREFFLHARRTPLE
jgi:23S rRNA (cytidine1920-2'-O)/16S rRNA (cytidine1409-2'-O)-methyltransferase